MHPCTHQVPVERELVVQDLVCLDLNVGRLALRAAERLVDHDARVGQAVALALLSRRQQERAHRRREADACCGHVRADVSHRVKDGHACGGARMPEGGQTGMGGACVRERRDRRHSPTRVNSCVRSQGGDACEAHCLGVVRGASAYHACTRPTWLGRSTCTSETDTDTATQVTEPPGELMYMVISFDGSTESRYNSWATTRLAMSSSTAPPMRTMRYGRESRQSGRGAAKLGSVSREGGCQHGRATRWQAGG
eukprot:365366-Chlamydomonas_euryale.AAC.13